MRRSMSFHLCPNCRQVNDADAPRCEACGAALRYEDTVPAAQQRQPASRSPGALWLDAQPPPVELTLRDVVTPRAPTPFPPIVHEEPLPASPPTAKAPDAKVPEETTAEDAAELVARDQARAARRAAVRRARLEAVAAESGDFVPEVLVMDRDGAARDALCTLLRAFGFGVHAVADAARGAALIAERPFTAVFVDIALDGADGGHGIEMCRRLHEARTKAVLVLVSAPLNAVARVRAQLLGFDGIVAKPVQRGDIARVLDAHGVPLPSDARRH
jgi:CheY-like chemotaxis protein